MSEANTNLLDIEAEHRDDIKTSELATFRTTLTNIKSKASTHLLANLESGLRGRIYTIEVLIGLITTPVQTLTQEFDHTKIIKRIDELLFETNIILLDIKTKYGEDIDTAELIALRTSLTNIERKTSIANTALDAWKACWRSTQPSKQQADTNLHKTTKEKDPGHGSLLQRATSPPIIFHTRKYAK